MQRFFRCTLRQMLLLILAASVLLAILAPRWWKYDRARQRELHWDQLLAAADAGDLAGVSRAIAAGAEPDVWKGNVGSPLSFAIRDGNLPLLDLLLKSGSDPNRDCRERVTPLEYAARLDRALLAERLLAAGAQLAGSRAPQICIEAGHEDTLKVLVKDRASASLLGFAIESELPREKKLSMVRLLLDRGAPADGVAREIPAFDYRETPMDLALRSPDGGIVDLLREHGAPYTAREAAVLGRVDDLRQMVEQDPSLLRQRFKPYYYLENDLHPTLLGLALRHAQRPAALFLIDAGAPLDGLEWYGESILFQAAVGGDPELIRTLAARGLSVDAPSNSSTPLCEAARRGHLPAVQALIELGADVNAQGGHADTPLHSAASTDQAKVAQALLAAGADPAAADREDRTALDIAKLQKGTAVIEVLEAAASKGQKD